MWRLGHLSQDFDVGGIEIGQAPLGRRSTCLSDRVAKVPRQLEAALVSENISMPPGSKWIVRSRVVCTPQGPIAYDVENRVVDPNGKELRKRSYKPGEERHTASTPPNGPSPLRNTPVELTEGSPSLGTVSNFTQMLCEMPS